MIRIISIFYFSLILISCSNHSSRDNLQTDTIVKDIPENKLDSQFIELRRRVEGSLGIENLENGYRDQQIRIWLPDSINQEKVIILKDSGAIWRGMLITLEYVYESSIQPHVKKRDSLLSIRKVASEIISPKSGWKTFIDSLMVLEILTLPDIGKLPGYTFMTDGVWLTVEIGNNKSYRTYSYELSPENVQRFIEVKKIIKILNLVDSEFRLGLRLVQAIKNEK